VGTIGLRRREDPEVPFWPAASILVEELGLWGGLRAMVYLSLLDQSTGRRELYVADVAVAPQFRRRGVGQALMRHAEEMARAWDKRALVLDVSTGNEAACRLYEQLGYEVQRTRRSLLTGWLLGERSWYRMRKDLG
jgi:ribosomal protein S18 acetylase RimI-like enzyme